MRPHVGPYIYLGGRSLEDMFQNFKLAITWVLSLDCNSLACECNWSCFNLVQTKKNRLGFLHYHILLFVISLLFCFHESKILQFFTEQVRFFANEEVGVCASQFKVG